MKLTALSRPLPLLLNGWTTAIFRAALVGCLFLSGTVHANNVVDKTTALQELATEKTLWTHPQWLKLLHYDVWEGRSSSRYRSQVDDPKFFVAPTGKTDPKAELLADIAAFFAAPKDEPATETSKGALTHNSHAQCHFVARLAWLQYHLGFDQSDLPATNCDDFRTWFELIRAERATLVFPSYHLNSPSSMFGHTLLRLDPANTEGWSEFLSFAVNFGAEVHADDNSMFYAFKGLTGGYPGRFNVDQYYKKIQEYNRDENRDIWEYPLNLTKQETQRMVMHLWELKETDFDYFFFDENCSYRVLELLEVARPGIDLTSNFKLTAIPIDTVRAVQMAGLTTGAEYRPSKAEVLKQKLAQLPMHLHERVLELSQDATLSAAPWFTDLDARTQAKLIEASYKYLRFEQRNRSRDEEASKRSFALLQLLKNHASALPESEELATTLASPDQSHGSRRLSAGVWSNGSHGYVKLGLRMSLHSLEENVIGFLPGAQINIANLDMQIDDDGDIDLHRLDLVDIFSLSPRDDFFQPMSWKIITGLERQYAKGRIHRVSHVTGGAGWSVSWYPRQQTYGLLMGRIENNDAYAHAIEPAIGTHLGLLQHFDGHTLRMELSGEKFANGDSRRRAIYEHNLSLSREQAVSLHVEREWRHGWNDTHVGLRYQYYY